MEETFIMGEKKNKAYVIPHTHWDREWRYPIWKNRMLLIEFMEELLDTLEHDKNYHCFLMDGQVAPIDDYLEVKPENREKVEQYIKEGRIAVGPWYTLPDLYPLDGECLIRNLLKGIRVSEKYGDYLKVGYNSFGWGQTAQFPQIYNGFGIDFIICAKKVSKERAPQSEFLWESPDGTQVLASRLGQHARGNFYFNTYLYAKYGINCLSSDFKYSPELSGTAIHNADSQHNDEDLFVIDSKTGYNPGRLKLGMESAWKATDATAAPSARLFLNGTDFSTSHPELSKMIDELNQLDPETEFLNSRLEEYAKQLHKVLDKNALSVVKGELRDGPSCDCSGNALASRIYLKQLNKKVQNTLIYKAEPLSCAANMLGIPYQSGFLNTAWRYVLQSHPHDSINGVTQDKTANDVEYRLNQAMEISQVAYDKSAAEIMKKIDLSAFSQNDHLLVVFNPHPYSYNEIIKISVCTPQEESVWSFTAQDCDNNPLLIQEISRDEKAYPVNDLVARPWPYAADRNFMYLETGDIPAMGYKVIQLKPSTHFSRKHFYWMEMRKSLGEDIVKTDNVLENNYLRVVINQNGTLKIFDKLNGNMFDGLHYFEDTGDVGNYWAYYPPYHNKTYTTLTGNVETWCEDNGPLSATIAIAYKMDLPEYGFESKHGVNGEGKRSDETKPFTIISRITLKKDSKRVDIKTTLKNNVRNHRLRVAFPTGIHAEYSNAAGHFTVDSRPSEPVKGADEKYWPEMQTLPMQTFVDVSDGKKGVALLNNCLTEYELKNDEKSTLYLTLFRAMGNTIVTWWEAVGEFADQTGSQLQRDMEFDYSIYPHEGGWENGHVYTEAQNMNLPIAPYQLCGHSAGTLPLKNSFLKFSNQNLILSAFKKAEDRNSFILRIFNPSSQMIKDNITFAAIVKNAWLCNLNEQRSENLCVNNENTVEIEAASNKIITVEFEVQ
jgi:mannosylglycerate hydrolase